MAQQRRWGRRAWITLLGTCAVLGGAVLMSYPLIGRAEAELGELHSSAERSRLKTELGLSEDSYRGLQAAIERTRYELRVPPSPSSTAEGGPVAYHGPNPRQGLRASFAA